jgi:protocatechuate 3,4-dioxygenase beta subunit
MLLLCSCNNSSDTKISENCEPTSFDEIGPFYRPNAPIRNKVGSGYFLKGRVLSSIKCAPLPRAKLEFWLVNSDGEYDNDHRATVIADSDGNYSFESNRPTDYFSRLPHIHMRITAPGHEELITQHYPKDGDARAEFDIVLSPASK